MESEQLMIAQINWMEHNFINHLKMLGDELLIDQIEPRHRDR